MGPVTAGSTGIRVSKAPGCGTAAIATHIGWKGICNNIRRIHGTRRGTSAGAGATGAASCASSNADWRANATANRQPGGYHSLPSEQTAGTGI